MDKKLVRLECDCEVAVCVSRECRCNGEWFEVTCDRPTLTGEAAKIAARHSVFGVPPGMEEFAQGLPRIER